MISVARNQDVCYVGQRILDSNMSGPIYKTSKKNWLTALDLQVPGKVQSRLDQIIKVSTVK